ncbi:MAG: hypothetical protein L3J24_13355 [Xanthomonadales bacterium]|nr:hypothetical protein [Xanthomonadales bacterium]
MKINRFIVGIVIIFGIVFSYFNFYSEKGDIADAQVEMGISHKNLAVVATGGVATTTNVTTTDDASNNQIKDIANKSDSLDSYITHFGNCSEPVNHDMEGKSQQQLSATLAFQNKCDAWLSDSDPHKYPEIKLDLERLAELAISPWDPYVHRPPPEDDEMLEYFRSRLNSPVHVISTVALWELLKRDAGFRTQLLATIGSSDHDKLRRYAIAIATLRSCMNLGGCGKNSLMMLNRCYSQESDCGVSYYDSAASRMSANEFDDLMLLAAAVDVILEQGLRPLNP